MEMNARQQKSWVATVGQAYATHQAHTHPVK